MKSIKKLFKITVLTVCCLFFSSLSAQEKLTAAQWQEDLRFLQETVHKKHSFLFEKVTVEKFDAKVAELHKAIPTMEGHEVMVGFLRIISLFEYGHTDMALKGGVLKYHKLPINLYQFNDGVYIEGGHQKYAKTIGAEIIEIEGIPIEKALEMIKPTVPVENDQYFKAYGINYLLIPEILHAQGITQSLKQNISFRLQKGGKKFKHTIKALNFEEVPRTLYSMVKQEREWLSSRSQGATPNYLKHLDKNYYFEYLPEQKTVYVRHSKVRNDKSGDMKSFFKEVFDFVDTNEVDKFILDVRLNGGGNNYLNKQIIQGIMERKKINQNGKFFTIIGRRTFSACQNLINELDNYTNVTFVGEPSAENLNFYGDSRTVNLPNSKIPAYLSFAWWQDKPQWENRDWTIPHIAVDMSFEEYRSNQDPVLNAVLAYSPKKGYVLNPLEHLRQLFLTQKYGQVKQDAAKFVKDPAYRYYNFEEEFTQTGNHLLDNGNLQGGAFVFGLLSELYPESVGTWYSLATTMEKAKQPAKAKQCYEKIISLDPKSPLAKLSRDRIKALGKN